MTQKDLRKIKDANNVTPFRKSILCPNCNSKSARQTYPFCSKRCADVDLARWFNGAYSIAEPNDPDNFHDR